VLLLPSKNLGSYLMCADKSKSQHWSEDPYWTEALDRFTASRRNGANEIVIDLDALDESIFDGDGPAFRAFEAMLSVREHEENVGYRGAPRVVMALLQLLSEQGRR